MKEVKRKLTAMLNAMTFAEAGEPGAAVEFLEQDSLQDETDAASDAASATPVVSRGRPLIQRLEDHMVAATFGEAGEFETAHALLPTETRPKAVLLIIDGQPADSDGFTHALHLCKRIRAEMEILAFAPGSGKVPGGEDTAGGPPELERATALSRRAQEHGVSCAVAMHTGNVDDCLFNYVRRHKEIAAVIYSSHGRRKAAGDRPSLQRARDTIVAKLAIPLVSVLRKRPVGVHS
ncbi:MAG: hypothetical protein LDL33_10545 [Desulfomonile sp.]|nr:hypothetical protein [Desulfomonile sp.]